MPSATVFICNGYKFIVVSAFMKTITAILILVIFTGCFRQAYYVSPMNGHTNSYSTIPLQSEKVKSATYAKGTVLLGILNDYGADASSAVQGAISRSHNFGSFQAYYGTGFTLGSYSLSPFDTGYNSTGLIAADINKHSGRNFFGAVGVDGGINVIVPMRGGEWRALGVETSLQQEFGEYLKARKAIPDSAVTHIVDNSFFGTLGCYTEIVDRTRTGSLSFKTGVGTVLGKKYHPTKGTSGQGYLSYWYINLTFQATINKWTIYFQPNFATKATVFSWGCNYKLPW